MERPYEAYFLEPGNKRFKGLIDNRTLAKIYNYMATRASVEKMLAASDNQRPALEALIEDIEALFPISEEFNLLLTHRHRQILGSMCRFLLQPEGYYPDKATKMNKGHYIQSATIYTKSNNKTFLELRE